MTLNLPAHRLLPPAAWRLAVLAIVAISPAPRLHAIDIRFSYDETDRPAFDPDGTHLKAMFTAAETYYESILLSPVVYEFEIWWENLSDSNDELGHTFINPFETDIVLDTKKNGVDRDWFFDPTPLDHTEFKFDLASTQTLYRHLSSTQQADGFNGQVPGELEVVYEAFARPGTAAVGKQDLFSTVIHEIGHVLGIHSEVIDDMNEYEFRAAQVGGVTNAAAAEDPNSDGHLAAQALMCNGCGDLGLRRLPSQTDLLAFDGVIPIPVGVPSVTVRPNLPRVNFIGAESTDWNGTLNWIGGRVPDDDNEVYVRNGGDVLLNGSHSTAAALVVDGGSSLQMRNNNLLQVFGIVQVGAAGGERSDLQVGNLAGPARLEAESLRLTNGSINIFSPENSVAVSGDLLINAGGTLMGAGVVEVAGLLSNNSEISGGTFVLFTSGGELTLRTTGAGALDLDGPTTNGQILATLGNLRVEGPLSDAFSGTATISAGRTMTFTQPWSLDGMLSLYGGSAGPATLAGAEVLLRGRVEVDGVANINASLTLDSGGSIHIPDAADRLSLTGFTILQGGAVTGNGLLAFGGSFAFVLADTTIEVAALDLDGDEGGASNRKFNVMNGKLTINSQQIDPFGAGYGGTLYINETGWLEVNAAGSWRVDKRLEMHSGSQGAARLSGSSTLIIVNGAVLATEALFFPPEDLFTPRIDAPLNVEGLVDASERPLLIGNTTTLAGGRITGAKTVNQVGDLVVWNSNRLNQIDPAIFLWGVGDPDHTTTLQAGAQLQMRTGRIGPVGSPNEYRGRIILQQDAFLSVDLTSSSTWTLAGSMQMGTNAAVNGDDVINTGVISGSGTFYVSKLENAGTVNVGDSIGVLRIGSGGRYVQTASGRLGIEVAGIQSGSQYDLLRIGLGATLDGTLSVDFINGYLPTAGARFDVLTASSVSGQFAALELFAPEGKFVEGRLLYATDRVTLEILDSGFAADFEPDGVVNGADLERWKAGFGTTKSASRKSGNSDGDLDVDGADFLAWQRQFGGVSAVDSGEPVPEPAALDLILLGGCIVAFRRSRGAKTSQQTFHCRGRFFGPRGGRVSNRSRR